MIEIFIEPELAELENDEASAEWLTIAESLGLAKQLATTMNSPERKAPPYMPMDGKTRAIVKTLCPDYCKYTEYTKSTIPLDILKEISKCVRHKWYKDIYIHYDNVSPDPFVVGYYEAGSWDNHYHLIARWGAEMLTWELLEAKAIVRLELEASHALQEMKAKMDIYTKNVNSFVRQMLNGTDIPRLNFSINRI